VTGVPLALALRLVAESLAAWGLAGEARCTDDGAIVIERTAGNTSLRIEPLPGDAMFRWMITIDGHRRPAISLAAVLRQVRSALDPEFAATRVRVAVAPLQVG
jgi:hypothetical protein